MIYIVSGHPRTGTSMMMKALSASANFRVLKSRSRERVNEVCGDEFYKVNPGGMFEIGSNAYMRYKFLSWLPSQDNVLVKMQYQGLPLLAKGSYKIVFMQRDPREIAESFKAAFNERLPKSFVNEYPALMAHIRDVMSARAGAEVTVMEYADVVRRPLEKFMGLNWPIKPEAAAATIVPEWYRFRAS